MHMRRWNFLEPLLMMVLELDDLPALIGLTLAFQLQIMVEQSSKIDRYLLTLYDILHCFDLVLPCNCIWTTRMGDWSPG